MKEETTDVLFDYSGNHVPVFDKKVLDEGGYVEQVGVFTTTLKYLGMRNNIIYFKDMQNGRMYQGCISILDYHLKRENIFYNELEGNFKFVDCGTRGVLLKEYEH